MLDGVPIGNLSAGALLAICILLILTGRLIPRKVYEDKSADYERIFKAYETEREARITADAQTAELLEGQKTMLHMIEAIFENSKTAAKKGGEDLVAS
jgi:hypothetical protein